MHLPITSPPFNFSAPDSYSTLLALGARGHLSRGDIEVTLRFFKQFIHTLSRGYMVESFAMYLPLWSQCKQWSHAGYFWNVPPKVSLFLFWCLHLNRVLNPWHSRTLATLAHLVKRLSCLAGHMVHHVLCHMIRHMFPHLTMTHHLWWLVMWSALYLSYLSATLVIGCHNLL